MLFAHSREANPDATPKEVAINVYRHSMLIELASVLVALFFAFVFGYLYEIWSRRSVLTLSFVLLGISMLQPSLGWVESQVMFALSRITSCVLVQAIMMNPLLNDYVKKGNHGWA